MVFIQTLTCSVLTGGVSGRVRAELRRRVAYPAVGTAVQAGEGLYGPGPQTGEPTRWSGVWGAGRGLQDSLIESRCVAADRSAPRQTPGVINTPTKSCFVGPCRGA